jgi:hypothetical protein
VRRLDDFDLKGGGMIGVEHLLMFDLGLLMMVFIVVYIVYFIE